MIFHFQFGTSLFKYLKVKFGSLMWPWIPKTLTSTNTESAVSFGAMVYKNWCSNQENLIFIRKTFIYSNQFNSPFTFQQQFFFRFTHCFGIARTSHEIKVNLFSIVAYGNFVWCFGCDDIAIIIDSAQLSLFIIYECKIMLNALRVLDIISIHSQHTLWRFWALLFFCFSSLHWSTLRAKKRIIFYKQKNEGGEHIKNQESNIWMACMETERFITIIS